MRDQAAAIASAEEVVRRVLTDQTGEAYRLATFLLHDRTAAEDAVQQAALTAWSHRKSLRDSERVEAWFMRIVVNVCRDELRRRRRGPRLIVVDADDKGASTVASGPDLGPALARLSADERTLLALRYGQDLTVPSIADVLQVPEGTVKSRLHAAVQHLRAAIDAERRREAGEP